MGQVAEWLVWSRLVGSSGGDLHVFLPLDDRGIDGIVHSISTDEYVPVQVKSQAASRGPYLKLMVLPTELRDERGFVVAVVVDPLTNTLGPHAVVVPIPVCRRLAGRYDSHGRIEYCAEFRLPPKAKSPWLPWCVPVDTIGQCLLSSAAGAPSVVIEERAWADAQALGYAAEMQLLSRAAESPRLNAFKAFPDLEPNEYLMYDTESTGLVGIQVKAVSFHGGAPDSTINIYRPALLPSAKTWFVVFVEHERGAGFHDTCLVIPSLKVVELMGGESRHGELPVTRNLTGRLAPWRVRLAELGTRLADVAAGTVRPL